MMADGIIKVLPEDVMMFILIRLNVKSLIRLKCVSKNLYTLLQSSMFINFHLKRTTTAKDEFILLKRSFQERPNKFKSILSFLFGVNDHIDLRPASPDQDVPYLTTNNSCIFHQLLGPCRGLIVLTDSESIVLFNPTTRNYRLLKSSNFNCPLGFYHDIKGVGFGFDSVVNDYKVVRVSEVIGDPPFNDFNVREWRVGVYDLITDSWRNLDHVDQQLPNLCWYPCSEMFYKGAVHWFATKDMVLILCFDLSTEIFRNMKMPDTCDFIDGKCYGLVVLDESLTLICYPNPGSVPKQGKELTDIWIMKEYGVNESWVKKYTIRPLPIESPLVIWRDHLLFLQSKSGLLITYDLHSEEVKEFNLQGFPKSLRIAIYKESLTPIPKG
ncbi:F-box protein CPR1-like [Nicotiana tabacum]|uniref:F-box protein CPR1-like n=1 Tax=Nicotiana tabacum TaxID=4097 RepID=A0AC58TCT5_TOBAC